MAARRRTRIVDLDGRWQRGDAALAAVLAQLETLAGTRRRTARAPWPWPDPAVQAVLAARAAGGPEHHRVELRTDPSLDPVPDEYRERAQAFPETYRRPLAAYDLTASRAMQERYFVAGYVHEIAQRSRAPVADFMVALAQALDEHLRATDQSGRAVIATLQAQIAAGGPYDDYRTVLAELVRIGNWALTWLDALGRPGAGPRKRPEPFRVCMYRLASRLVADHPEHLLVVEDVTMLAWLGGWQKELEAARAVTRTTHVARAIEREARRRGWRGQTRTSLTTFLFSRAPE